MDPRQKHALYGLLGGMIFSAHYFSSSLRIYVFSDTLIEMCLNETKEESELARRTLTWNKNLEKLENEGRLTEAIKELQI